MKQYDLLEIAQISVWEAIEIDNYLNGRGIGFNNVQKLAEIFERYPPETFTSYVTLWTALREDSDKRLKTMDELALETRLLVAELRDVPRNFERLGGLRSALVDINDKFLEEHSERYRLVA